MADLGLPPTIALTLVSMAAACIFELPDVVEPAPGEGGGAGGDNGTGGEGATASAGGAGGAGALIFSDEFDTADKLWMPVGDGVWSVVNGEMVQSDPAAELSYNYVPSMADHTDYRIVARMRQISGETGGAMEVDFRISAAASDEQYSCNWEPNNGDLLIMQRFVAMSSTVLDTVHVDTTTIPGYDPLMPVTMEIVIMGDTFHCWLHEIAGADLTVSEGSYSSGAFGFKNWRMATAYDYIRVYAL